MIKVCILASEKGLFSTVFGPFDMLIQAGVFWNAIIGEQATPYFDVCIASVDGREIGGLNGARIVPHRKIKASDSFDLIIVPSEGMNIQADDDGFRKRVEYLTKMHTKGTVVASVCTGAFLLAATGLLDGKTATTHWALAEHFKRLFPKVQLNPDLLICDNDTVITAGGVSADQDLCMHIISKLCGHEVALQTARCTMIDLSARKQAHFKTFVVEKGHGDAEVLACQDYIEKHLGEEISVAELSDRFAMGRRTLHRRFKQATGHSLVNYIQQLRVEKAKHSLATEKISFEELSYSLGYENVSYFRRVFKQYVGLSPKDFRRAFYQSTYGAKII